MASIKRIYTNIIFIFFLAFPVCMCAESKKDASKGQVKYEVKSDIINFDYANIGFPVKSVDIGINNSNKSTPRELKRGEPKQESTLYLISLGFFDGVIVVFVTLLLIGVIWLIGFFISYLFKIP